MSNIFQNVVTGRKHYNNFPLGHEVLLSGQIGKLIPIQCDEVVPGDKYRQSAAFLCRFTPLSAPAMARFNVHFHSFYVPFRIITPETSRESTYERFIRSIGKHSSEVPHLPTMYGSVLNNAYNFNPFAVGSLSDYLGFPTTLRSITMGADVSVKAHLTYQRIYQDFYRRDQLETEVIYPSNLEYVDFENIPSTILEGDYPELEENQRQASLYDLFKLQTRNYERDYFTSALPSPQFGDEVSIGDGLVSWLNMSETETETYNFGLYGRIYQEHNTTSNPTLSMVPNTSNSPEFYLLNSSNAGPNWNVSGLASVTDELGQALVKNMSANSITINEFRLAMQLQGIKEKINRVGTRYLEIMEGIYNVRVPDARLQRPIYLGGFKSSVTIGSVMQTSESNTTPQGTLTGQMSSSGSNTLVNGGYEFKEHGYLMTIMSITPRTSYFGGIPRKFLKRYPEDFYLPQFDHLGEQEIYNAELYVGDTIDDHVRDEVFGYTPRYAELKSSFSTVHGEFRTTLANWHVSRSFDEQPSLNPDFIKADPKDFDRIFAFQDVENTSNEHFYMQVYIDVVAKRNMSKYSTPYTLY